MSLGLSPFSGIPLGDSFTLVTRPPATPIPHSIPQRSLKGPIPYQQCTSGCVQLWQHRHCHRPLQPPLRHYHHPTCLLSQRPLDAHPIWQHPPEHLHRHPHSLRMTLQILKDLLPLASMHVRLYRQGLCCSMGGLVLCWPQPL